MSDHDPDIASNVAAGIAAMRRASALTKQTIDSHPDPQRQLELNADLDRALTEELRDVHVRRDRKTADIWKREELSLAKLAAKIGVSKARTDQIIREQRRRAESSKEAGDE